MRPSRLLLLLASIAGTGWLAAQTPPPSGAKDLFYDPVGGGTLSVRPVAPGPAPAPNKDRQAARRLPSLPASSPTAPARNVGLSYWLELEGAGEKTEQV